MSANKIGLTQSSLVARRLVSFIYSDTARYGFSTDHTAHVAPHGPLNNPPLCGSVAIDRLSTDRLRQAHSAPKP